MSRLSHDATPGGNIPPAGGARPGERPVGGTPGPEPYHPEHPDVRQEIIMGLRDHGVVGTVDLVEEISSYLSHHAEAPWFAEAAARLEDFLFYVERMQDEYGVTTEPVTPPKP